MHSDDHDDYTDWIALLDDDDDLPSADRSALVDRLGPAFAAHHRNRKRDIRHALIPVVQHTHQLQNAIQTDVFPNRALGLTQLGNASVRFENAARCDLTAAHSVYDESKRILDALFSTLDDLVHESDLLFNTFKTTMLEHVQRLRFSANQMPIDAERLISTLEKRAKHLGAEDHAKAKENLLRGILDKY